MPKSASYTLTWLSSNQTYGLYEGQEDDRLALAPGSPAWSVRMSQISSFAFHGQNGSCTVRKERKLRGGGYWYAYARVAGNLTKRYLGRDIDLTLARLEQVVQAFRLDPPAAVCQKPARASSPLQLVAPTPREASGLHADSLSQAHAWSSAGTRPQRDGGVGRRQAEVSALIAGLPSESLLATKLHAPRPRAHLLHRPRLLQRVQEGRERALTLLSAPAGFGKSTLLGDWLSSGAIPAA
jgi:LuxR family maltose regulon positive regulatory protein